MTVFEETKKRCEQIEECYEFMLAYAAQGIPDDRGNNNGSQLRELLTGAVEAATGLSASYAALVKDLGLTTSKKYTNFIELLEQDASKALTAMELVLGQPRISSQLIDNLNASLHVRTLLTDVFLLDEILQIHTSA